MPLEVGCPSVTNAFIAETGRIGPELFQRSARKRPIIGLIGADRGVWQHGMGVTVSNMTFERSMSTTTTDPWTTAAASDGSNNLCLPAVTEVTFGQTQQNMTPRTMALETEYFCIRDLQFDWQFVKVMNAVKNVLTDRTSWEWARKWTQDYYDIAGHNITIRTGGNYDNGSSGYSTANPPTGTLDFGTLEEIYQAQYREGSSITRYQQEDTGAMAGEIIMSDEQYKNLLRQNPTLANQINYAYMGAKGDNPLLPSGIERRRKLFGNWVIYTDPYPRRFALTGGNYVEVPVWVSSSTTKGQKQTINPAWLSAPYEEIIVYTPDNMRSLAYNTLTNPAPGWNFNALNSMGDWSARNILERDCNPDGTNIFFRAVFGDVAEPVNPTVGYTLLALRCNYPHAVNPNCYY
jgi:hypothetical protein